MESLSHKNQQKLKNVFGGDAKVEQMEAATTLIRKIQSIGEDVARVQTSLTTDRARRLADFLRRQISKRINKLSHKIHKISEQAAAGTRGPARNPRGNRFDFLRNDEDFNYEIGGGSQKEAQRFETEIRRMENVEMTRLTESIEAVNKLFVNMSNLVFEQGTIIDRIDSNIATAVERVEHANVQLLRAVEHQNSGLADYLIRVLGLLVLALAALLFFKYS